VSTWATVYSDHHTIDHAVTFEESGHAVMNWAGRTQRANRDGNHAQQYPEQYNLDRSFHEHFVHEYLSIRTECWWRCEIYVGLFAVGVRDMVTGTASLARKSLYTHSLSPNKQNPYRPENPA
jgi:hypothetical protein